MTKSVKQKPPASMRQVATEAGVSVATVSQLLSGKPSNIRVSEATRRRVLTTCRQVGYEPNIHAQRLFSRRSKTLGIVFPPLEEHLRIKHAPDLVLAGIMQGAASMAAQLGYHISLNPADANFFKRKEYLRLFRSCAVDGLLIWGICLQDSYVDEMAREGMPFVMTQSTVANAKEAQYAYVVADNQKAASDLTKYLLDLGHQTIGYVRGFQSSSVGVELWNGFRETMVKHKLFRPDLIFDGDYTLESGKRAAETLLQACPQLTAIACANELMAAGAIEYVTQSGRRVPEDVSVSGYGAVHSILIKPLTTCDDPNYDMGALATERLINFIKNRPADKNTPDFQIVLPTKLRIGATTGPPPITKAP